MHILQIRPNRVLAILVLGLSSLSASAQVAVIVNPKSPTASMTAKQVADIFLGRNTTLPSGTTAAAVDQPPSSAVRDPFYLKVTGMNPPQVKAAWSRLVFAGKGTPPMELSSSVEVKRFVAANPNAIGYIEKSAVDGSVKVVLTVD